MSQQLKFDRRDSSSESNSKAGTDSSKRKWNPPTVRKLPLRDTSTGHAGMTDNTSFSLS